MRNKGLKALFNANKKIVLVILTKLNPLLGDKTYIGLKSFNVIRLGDNAAVKHYETNS